MTRKLSSRILRQNECYWPTFFKINFFHGFSRETENCLFSKELFTLNCWAECLFLSRKIKIRKFAYKGVKITKKKPNQQTLNASNVRERHFVFLFCLLLFVSVSRPFAFRMKYFSFSSKYHIFLFFFFWKSIQLKKGKNFSLAETMSAGHWPLRQQSHL